MYLQWLLPCTVTAMLALSNRAMAVVAYIFSTMTPHYHAFSLQDPSISYPFVADTVTMGMVAIIALALSLASALLITLGLKNFGKPRPSALARCQPDISLVETYKVSGYGNGSSASVMVDYRICQQPDNYQLNQAFDSWPSGHATGKLVLLLSEQISSR